MDKSKISSMKGPWSIYRYHVRDSNPLPSCDFPATQVYRPHLVTVSLIFGLVLVRLTVE